MVSGPIGNSTWCMDGERPGMHIFINLKVPCITWTCIRNNVSLHRGSSSCNMMERFTMSLAWGKGRPTQDF